MWYKIKLDFLSGNSPKLQRLTSFLQQLAPGQDDENKDWCGRGSGVTNATCPSNDMVCYKETWDLDGQMSKYYSIVASFI